MPPSQPRSSQQAAPPTSIPDNRLGLSPQDVATLRQHQQLAHAQARSPTGSQASSQGRLLLDPGSLQLLSRHFDRVMQAIGQRLEQLNHATEIATEAQYDRAGNAIQMADAEIARFRAILHQIDELETEFDKIKRIREIVRSFRARVEQMERRLG
ncbi:hypothetical protein LTR36_000458 [Oleoguttula mirabilis]|uniref:Biogenesis of lysosome-related organelles complex 1 subunit CNL1 n=1 Tax=Oleoguttula mirabilis TaxID=1507867 RepID=A0AAV9JYK9_9PEZI|nr:hypothetical protein LTR36_000458 [Oleoguttula mirabilis]